jgi:hypothetical protein
VVTEQSGRAGCALLVDEFAYHAEELSGPLDVLAWCCGWTHPTSRRLPQGLSMWSVADMLGTVTLQYQQCASSACALGQLVRYVVGGGWVRHTCAAQSLSHVGGLLLCWYPPDTHATPADPCCAACCVAALRVVLCVAAHAHFRPPCCANSPPPPPVRSVHVAVEWG